MRVADKAARWLLLEEEEMVWWVEREEEEGEGEARPSERAAPIPILPDFWSVDSSALRRRFSPRSLAISGAALAALETLLTWTADSRRSSLLMRMSRLCSKAWKSLAKSRSMPRMRVLKLSMRASIVFTARRRFLLKPGSMPETTSSVGR